MAAKIAKFLLYTHFQRDVDGKLVLPDDKNNVILSDKIPYAAKKKLIQKERAA